MEGRLPDELIPGSMLPGGGTEDHHGQLPAADIAGDILDVFTDGTAKASIMVLLQQACDVTALGQRFHPFEMHRLQGGQGLIDGDGL